MRPRQGIPVFDPPLLRPWRPTCGARGRPPYLFILLDPLIRQVGDRYKDLVWQRLGLWWSLTSGCRKGPVGAGPFPIARQCACWRPQAQRATGKQREATRGSSFGNVGRSFIQVKKCVFEISVPPYIPSLYTGRPTHYHYTTSTLVTVCYTVQLLRMSQRAR